MRSEARPTANRARPPIAVGDADRGAGGIEETRGGLGDPLQGLLGVGGCRRDRAQDLGTGLLAIDGRTQLVLQPEIDQRGRGLPFDRLVALGDDRLQPLLKLQNPAPEIGFRVMGKRGHSGQIQVARRTPSVPGSNVHKPFWAHDYSIPAAVRPAPEALFSDRGVNAVGA